MNCKNCGAPLVITNSVIECPYCGVKLYGKAATISDRTLHGTVSIGILNGAAIPLVAKGTRLPAEVVSSFSTATDYQESIDVTVVFGENHLTIDNIPVGTFSLKNITPTLRGIPKIDIQIKVDENKLLTVTATEASSGRREIIGKADISGLGVPPYRGNPTFSEENKDEFRRRR
jgi:molecular chaperone DnaK